MSTERRTDSVARASVTAASCKRRGLVRAIGVLAVACGVVVAGAWIALSGCGASQVLPIESGATLPSGVSGNVPPTLTFLDPTVDIEVEPGDVVFITYTVIDPDDNAPYEISLDPDGTPDNGNEIVLTSGLSNDVPTTGETISVDTTGLATGTYLVRGRVDDGTNPAIRTSATGRILVIPAGLRPRNRPPFLTVLGPDSVQGVIQGDTVTVEWCARDPDDDAHVLILLDYDQDVSNDVKFETPEQIDAVCNGPLPRDLGDAILLACETENDCGTPLPDPDPTDDVAPPNAPTQTLDWVIDVTEIPPRADGQPYRIRVDVADGTNPTVHRYAGGGISVLAVVNEAVIDVGQVGRSIAGATFQGFTFGGRCGSAFTRVGDIDNDGTDEFLIVAQYGRSFEFGPVGSAWMAYGRTQRFGGVIPANSIGTSIRGVGFGAPTADATDGIVSVAVIENLGVGDNGDGLPEILFGLPYVDAFYDHHDDTPCDCECCCYVSRIRGGGGLQGSAASDLLPNPADPAPDDAPDVPMADRDYLELVTNVDDEELGPFLCSNDGDLSIQTPIISGYAWYVDSTTFTTGVEADVPPFLDASTIYLGAVGDGFGFPYGALFRGAWYDLQDASQVDFPYRIAPLTQFGLTVASMPDLADGGSVRAKDNQDELLYSAPNAYDERGQVVLTFGQDIKAFRGSNGEAAVTNSIPHYGCHSTGDPCLATRDLWYPGYVEFAGSAPGDHLGYAGAAGDFNLDGNQDVLMGAPGADRSGFVDNGVLYILFGRLDITDIYFDELNPPRVEIHGISSGEELGKMQRLVDDVNGDSLPDVAFGTPKFSPSGLSEAGMVGVIFGGRFLTGENIYDVTQIATNQLPGVRFLGTQQDGLAGAHVSSAGDFNADGYGDLLIVAPNEFQSINGQLRRGVVYLVFGGFHLYNKVFLLSQVGTAELPGIKFVSPFAFGTADEASLECAEAAGDVDGDGFGDILIGAPAADYVNPAEPSQRRIDAGEAYLIYGDNRISTIGG
jgi:hypothetical protein